jgi:5-methylthioadenosine/S-adenosylhomocysteine deaminase
VGALADCILVDLDHPALVPGHNLISDLVYSANGDCVDTTICNGRILMRHRIVDREKEIIELVRARVKALTS